MRCDSHVQQLVDEILESHRNPEDVCRDCPELLPEVRDWLRRIRAVESQVRALFPPPGSVPTPPEPPDVGPPRLAGYEVQAVLGRGGMGVVYKAWDCRLNRPVALKVLHAGPYASPEELERFLRGAKAEAGLRQANIVQVYDVGDMDGQPYLIMEYVEGGSLAQRLSGTPFDACQAATLVATLAGAVHVAHVGGVVHRDLKPGNVLLTSDGAPKIADFGLARRLDDGGGLTQTGAAIGTPSYMSPEQAQGMTHAIGPAADVYALGAILYELLTGRPPFRSGSKVETTRQVIEEEPVPPSRSNAAVPRDLETICLKCLQKAPQSRYGSAALLADDLHRFRRGDSIAARPAGVRERFARWIRRRRAGAAAVVAATLLGTGLVGAGLWLRSQRNEIAQGIEDDLRELGLRQQESNWTLANIALERARGRLGRGGPTELYRRLDKARSDLDKARREQELVTHLDGIHLKRMTLVEGRFNPAAQRRFNNARADRDYEVAFREAGLGAPYDDPADVAARVASSDARTSLVTGLDDWAVCAADPRRQVWVLGVARRADPNAWRDRVRDPLAWRDQAALVELARVAPVAGQPVHLLVALGERLQAMGGNGTEFLARVQQEHRRDFWANFTLGTVHLEKGQMDEALRLYRETGTIWPRVAALDNNLGLVWYSKYYLPGAMECYQNAIRKNPTFAPVHNNFGLALKAKGQLDDAIDHYREALSLDPELALAHSNLGEVLAGKGQLDNAMGHYRASLRIDPEYARCHYLLGVALTGKGRLDEANDRFQEALRIDPADARAHDKIFGFALDEGIEHHKRCHWLDPRFTVSHNNLGLSERDMGRLNEAIGHYERALQLEPELHKARAALGQALLALGRFSEAQAATHSCLERLPRGNELHTNLLAQLQRCERLLALQDRLPAVLQGKDRPADAAEAEQFAELCGMKSQIVAAARLYSDAFAASPRSAEELHSDHRYTAACAAALAGCGRGQDHAALSEAELAHWRERAREWLRAELAVWSQGLDNGPDADRVLVRQKLAHLWSDPDLAGLFERDALNKLPSAERQECRTLWADIDTLIRRAQSLK